MSKINASQEELVEFLYQVLDSIGNLSNDDLYSEINQFLLAVVVDDE